MAAVLDFFMQQNTQKPQYPDFDQLASLKVSYQHCIRIAIPLHYIMNNNIVYSVYQMRYYFIVEIGDVQMPN